MSLIDAIIAANMVGGKGNGVTTNERILELTTPLIAGETVQLSNEESKNVTALLEAPLPCTVLFTIEGIGAISANFYFNSPPIDGDSFTPNLLIWTLVMPSGEVIQVTITEGTDAHGKDCGFATVDFFLFQLAEME